MKLISTLFAGAEIEAILNIQSRATRTKDGNTGGDEPLIVRYKSRIGNQSLIFSPTVALVLRGRGKTQMDAWIPVNLFYRFTSTLSHAYHSLSTDKLYYSDGGTMYVDRKIADAQARKISLFRNSLTLSPDIAYDRTGKQMKGILFSIDGNAMGVMSHNEVLGMVEIMDHFDVNTYSLLAGVVDELESMNSKIDTVLMSVGRIEKLLTKLDQGTKIPLSSFGLPDKHAPMQWENAQTNMF
ncbi:MAG: hypothetical protein NC114_09955 [Ruminococcus flavefaciens]|nr:hypothetical protein [Ruminococcus flavefaciens]